MALKTKASATIPFTTPRKIVPRAQVASEWTFSHERLHLLIPRFKGPLFGRLLNFVVPDHRKWKRYPLDPRGSRIWSLIDSRRSVDDLVRDYGEMYPSDADQLESRMWCFLQVLEHHGFLVMDRD